MHRDSICLQTILIIGCCISLGVSGCDRTDPTRKPQSTPTTGSDAPQRPPIVSAPQAHQPTEAEVSLPAEPTITAKETFRSVDKRQQPDDQRLNQIGIRVFESKHLKLYTDLDPDKAVALPQLVDQLYPHWESELGPMLPDQAGTDFQMTGYLIRDLALFRENQLIPEEISLEHGRHRQNEFWLRDQASDYYRQHLLLHEATHCFMTSLPNVVAPYWYLEGMAEYFATHEQREDQPTWFCIIPSAPARFVGLGRIECIRGDVAKQQLPTIESIVKWEATEFRTISQYAWSWALCAFLDQTPHYHDRFKELSHWTQSSHFQKEFLTRFPPDDRDLATEWTLFATNLQYGYNPVRAAIEFRSGQPLTDQSPEKETKVVASRGWQSSQIRLVSGEEYEVAATGQFTLGQLPKPWISEADGITYRYFGGYPIGKLIGCVREENGPARGMTDPMLKAIPLGQKSQFRATSNGTLYLRLNDAWNSLVDNQGEVTVTIRRAAKSSE